MGSSKSSVFLEMPVFGKQGYLYNRIQFIVGMADSSQ